MAGKTPNQSFGDAIRFPELPKNQGSVGVTATLGGDVAASGSVSVDLGKSATVNASGSYWKDKGWEIMAWLGFGKK